MKEQTYFRLYLRGLHVGIGVRAERIEVDGPSVFLWNGTGMVASFWLADISEVRDLGNRRVALLERRAA